MAWATCMQSTFQEMPSLPCSAQEASRTRALSASLAWMVDSEPPWPVFWPAQDEQAQPRAGVQLAEQAHPALDRGRNLAARQAGRRAGRQPPHGDQLAAPRQAGAPVVQPAPVGDLGRQRARLAARLAERGCRRAPHQIKRTPGSEPRLAGS